MIDHSQATARIYRSQSDHMPRFKKLHPDAQIPRRHYADDIGWDLAARLDEPMRIAPGAYADVPCDLAVELPRGTWGMLVGRSSALRRHRLIMNTGIIDEGYIGELFAGAFNPTGDEILVMPETRLAQLIIVPRHDPIALEPYEVDQLRKTSRGCAGFGSTG